MESFALDRRPAGLAQPFVEPFGVIDAPAGAALGKDRIRRHRTSSHGRR